MNILGVSAFYHDSAACLVRDGDIVEQVPGVVTSGVLEAVEMFGEG